MREGKISAQYLKAETRDSESVIVHSALTWGEGRPRFVRDCKPSVIFVHLHRKDCYLFGNPLLSGILRTDTF